MIAINVGFYLGYKKLRQVSRENFPRLIKPAQLFAAEQNLGSNLDYYNKA
jgi:hypothetical protein